MTYYNIHTHSLPTHPDERFIVSIDIRKPLSLDTWNYYSAGIHPWYASEDDLIILQQIASLDHIVAIGEAGLDRCAEVSWTLQNNIFRSQIEIAESVQKPLIIHCVRAWPELLAHHRTSRSSHPWIIHGFRGKKELARELLREGFYLSFGPYYHPDAVIEAWNSHRLFVETDQYNVDIRSIYTSITSLLSVSQADLSQEIHANLQAWNSFND